MKNSTSRAGRIAGMILIFLGVLMLIGSSLAKFAQAPPVVAKLAAVGFGGSKLLIIAALRS